MLFNSLSFAIFLPVVFLLYWFVFQKTLRLQNMLLLVASYVFYAFWDWRFLFLLAFSTFLDYYTGLKIYDAKNKAAMRFWLTLSVVINLGFLAVFKYYNFFAASFVELFAGLGITMHASSLQIILPVGISFYTFHGLSYVFDLYNRKIEPSRNFVNYSLFVSFFPLLVAGPIERATHLLPQVEKNRTFNYSQAVNGLRQMLWGLFKKIVIADNCAVFANEMFNNSQGNHGISLVLGAVFFAFQIYGDFSGYSDIALGVARLFGIELLRNFAYPYFSRDIAEFWRRWHISLSSWFKDYLYIPLGGSRKGTWGRVRNTFIIFLVSGLWHGANWTFVAWGFLNALFIMPLIIFRLNRNNLETVATGRVLPTMRELMAMIITFALTCFAWIFFRADSIAHAFQYIGNIFTVNFLDFSAVPNPATLLLILFFIVIEWQGRFNNYAIENFAVNRMAVLRWGFYACIAMAIFLFYGKQQQFIYFQF